MPRYVISSLSIVLLSVAPMHGDESGEPPARATINVTEARFVGLHAAYLKKLKPLKIESNRAWWEASTTGTDEAFQRRTRAENALVELHSDAETFAELSSLRQSRQVRRPLLKRELDVIYMAFQPGQADPSLQKRIVALESEVDQIFNTHRGEIDGRAKSENDIRTILADTDDSDLARKAWMAYIQVGGKIQQKLRELVTLRNRMAGQLGYKNFFSMRLALQEIEEDELLKLFDELDVLTKEPFARLKRDIDERMAERFGVDVAALRPWHFGDLFFQEAPSLAAVSLDDVLKDRDLVAMAKVYYESLGMPVEKIIARSDLYEKEGKSPHAFCSDLDRVGDVRVLCNLKNNAYWMDTLVHELGHAVYDTNISHHLPFILREASHSITTEGIAMMFGAMVKKEEWLRRVLGLPDDEVKRLASTVRANLRAEKLIFSRWTQVMVRFEHAMYSQPDQDLSKLWWSLKKRYQLMSPPDDVNLPGYAAKMHIVGAPVYYHSYMMGELFASQVRHHIASSVLHLDDARSSCFFGSKAAGDYLRKEIFVPGKLYPWYELTKRATGEPLTAKYFAEQYVD